MNAVAEFASSASLSSRSWKMFTNKFSRIAASCEVYAPTFSRVLSTNAFKSDTSARA